MSSAPNRIAILGMGAIGQRVFEGLQSTLAPSASYALLDRRPILVERGEANAVRQFDSLEALLAWRPDLAIECAGHAVVSGVVPHLLRAGTDVVLVSIGALVDADLRKRIDASAAAGRSRLVTVSGAIGGLDALEAARSAGLDSVIYTGRKPPLAWKDTPAETAFDLDDLREPTVIFRGSAAESAVLYPKNANVTAAVALAGLGFDGTEVRLIADPTSSVNVHELDVVGAFGRFGIRLENNPLPYNPKTSWLAALSIEAALRRHLHHSISN